MAEQRTHLVPYEALTSLYGQNRTQSVSGLSVAPAVLPLWTLKLRFSSTLLALYVSLVLGDLVRRQGLIALIDLHVPVRTGLLPSAPGRVSVGVAIVVMVAGRSSAPVVLFVLGTGVVVRRTIAVVVLKRDLLVACPGRRRRGAADGPSTEEVRVGVAAHSRRRRCCCRGCLMTEVGLQEATWSMCVRQLVVVVRA